MYQCLKFFWSSSTSCLYFISSITLRRMLLSLWCLSAPFYFYLLKGQISTPYNKKRNNIIAVLFLDLNWFIIYRAIFIHMNFQQLSILVLLSPISSPFWVIQVIHIFQLLVIWIPNSREGSIIFKQTSENVFWFEK